MFDNNDQNRNLLLAIALSLLVLVVWQSYIAPPPPEPDSQGDSAATDQTAAGSQNSAPDIIAGPEQDSDIDVVLTREQALAGQRLTLEAQRLTGSINLANGRIDDITLTDYRQTTDPNSRHISLLSPRGSPNAYFAEFSWRDDDGNFRARGDIGWQADSDVLSQDRPVELRWTDPDGLEFRRTVSIDDNYMFTITDRVTNTGADRVSLAPVGRVQRANTPEDTGFYILHVGAIGVLDGKIEDEDYDNLRDDGPYSFSDTTGWLGITAKYWLTAMIPGQDIGTFDAQYVHIPRGDRDDYQVSFVGEEKNLAPGETAEATVRLFVGAKEVGLLTRYMEELDIERFDMAIHFGWFFFLTKPLLSVLIYFAELLGNFGLSILLVTVIIKLIFFPLANKSYASMSKMKALQPKMTELREKYGDDKQKMQTELMALYKREKVNPVSGCLPIALQIPVFFALYKVLFISIEMRQAPFFGWIQDLSAPDPLIVTTLFGLIPWSPPDFLAIGIWPLIMGISMFLQQKLNPAPPDPVQAKVFMLMPVIFTAILARFPAGLVIYWTWNNLLSMAQQYVIMRRMGVKVGGGQTS